VSGGADARRVALDALVRIDAQGAYANLVTNTLLERSGLDDRDRRFVTELVYGTTRMRRACDHLIARHRRTPVAPRVAAALRAGAYQLAFASVPPHAAVDATVAASPRPARGLVNAVLRRVSDDVADGIEWPDTATELSYPDWIIAEVADLVGTEDAESALRSMNLPAVTHVRSDGYVQDPASQRVVELVSAQPGDTVVDLCAAPGGKATGIAATGATVLAADARESRTRLLQANASRFGNVLVVAADGRAAPVRRHHFDRVLVDAPCSGLGVLRRRPDARWRVDPGAPRRLRELQAELLGEAASLLAPGGTLVYSVCTLTRDESRGAVSSAALPASLAAVHTELLLPTPQRDGMFVAVWQRC
jgi:16S rRNA (cytosine967-C5)-methyltransferase